ncbi:DUF2177 family protein [Nocardioidaceae bacterium]|nr:DUF2177 family protein [Nocardioidaceae bacterium]
MSARTFGVAYAAALVAFVVVDGVWLAFIGGPFYREQLSDLRAEEANLWAAAIFYLLYLGGVVHLIVRPHLASGSVRPVLRDGAVLGLVSYAAWDLTNAAVIEDFPLVLVPIDLAWGTVLTAVVAGAAWVVARRAGGGRRTQPS